MWRESRHRETADRWGRGKAFFVVCKPLLNLVESISYSNANQFFVTPTV
jgi:hypothetical protein